MLYRLFLLFCLLACCFPLHAQLHGLDAAINSLELDSDMRSANWSVSVINAKTGKLLSSHEPYRSLPTASTMKVVTSATALAILGPDYRFPTILEYKGQISSDGTLEGNLYIRGSGDPTLGTDRFGEDWKADKILAQWVEEIKAAGIKKINGKILGDAEVFSSQLTPGDWSWQDMGNYYGAGASGLNFMENEYTLYLKPGSRQGLAAQVVSTQPPLEEVAFVNELGTGSPGSGDQAYIFGSPYTSIRYLRGTIPAGRSSFSIRGSLPEPAFTCARLLGEQLQLCGIEIQGGHSTMRRELLSRQEQAGTNGRKLIHTHFSPTLREILIPLNQESLNLYAESLFKAVAARRGKKGSTDAASDITEEYWKERGLDSRGLFIRDGSGLSSNNGLSSYQLASILGQAHRANYGQDLFVSLPLAGRSGTLSHMLKGTAAEGKMRAKSGTISSTRAYAGYMPLSDGRVLAFAMIANNYSCSSGQMRRKLERLMAKLATGK